MDSEFETIRAADEAFFTECTRVGFGIRELGAVLLTDHAGSPSLADAMAVLRSLPAGAGFKAFCDRMPDGPALWAAHEAGEAAEAGRPTRCSFCRRAATAERRLVQGPARVAICRECAEQAADALA